MESHEYLSLGRTWSSLSAVNTDLVGYSTGTASPQNQNLINLKPYFPARFSSLSQVYREASYAGGKWAAHQRPSDCKGASPACLSCFHYSETEILIIELIFQKPKCKSVPPAALIMNAGKRDIRKKKGWEIWGWGRNVFLGVINLKR